MNATENTVMIPAMPLGSVKMTDAYCVNAVSKEVSYLKAFDNDRVLAGFRLNAGIKTDSKPYGGWEEHLIGGHAMGHYFSALAQASVNPGIPEPDRKELREKLCEIIDGLAECQLEDGFLWAGRISDPENIRIQFDLVEQGRGNEDIINVAWVPWYTLHKILAGLLDAAQIAGIDKALDIAKKLGDWVYSRTENWSVETRQTVLATEYGGMNDVMYRLFDITGELRYADAAHAFDEEALFGDILTGGHNLLTGRHANTTIPKIIGMLMRYTVCNGKTVGVKHQYKVEASGYLKVAELFWDNVLAHHTYHTGGNSEWEHFREDDSLDKNRTNANCETCNVYNMLKLTRLLFSATGKKKYADYLENAFYNHILASQDPGTGMTTYFQSMATGYFKVFSSPWNDFWCCTGSGMENFTKLGDSAYFGDKNRLMIIKYLPSVLKIPSCEVSVDSSPAQDKITVTVKEGSPVIMLRVPDWADGEIKVTVNGAPYESAEKGGFIEVKTSEGCVIDLSVPISLKAVSLSDNADIAAFRYGPWLLAGKLGNENMVLGRTGVNVAIPEKSVGDGCLNIGATADELKRNPAAYAEQIGPCSFRIGGVEFVPYREITERYGIYWKIA